MSLLDKLKELIAAEEAPGDPPADNPGAGDAEPPAWAKSIVDRLDALEAVSTEPTGSSSVPDSASPLAKGSSPADSAPAGAPGSPPAGAAPPATSTATTPWTAERVKALSPDELDKHWDEIAAQWRAEEGG